MSVLGARHVLLVVVTASLLPLPVHPVPRPRPSPYPHPYPPPSDSQVRYHDEEEDEYEHPEWMLMPDGHGDVRLAMLSPEPLRHLEDDEDPGSSVGFILYTREHRDIGEMGSYNTSCRSLGFSRFSPNRPTKVLVHGFGDAAKESLMFPLLRDAFLSKGDFNVFFVDWAPLAKVPWYRTAAYNTMVAGQMTARLVDDLEATRGARTSDFHLVGFSLGAHVVGIAGKMLADRRPDDADARVHKITGLDPAQVLFTTSGPEERIDSSDADFVEIVHTSGGYLGFMQPLGHVDVYPNGGAWPQPGCVLDFVAVCSHRRAYYIYSEAIRTGGIGFEAKPCQSWDNLEIGDCEGSSYSLGTDDEEQRAARGLFFLDTNDEEPFARTEDNAV